MVFRRHFFSNNCRTTLANNFLNIVRICKILYAINYHYQIAVMNNTYIHHKGYLVLIDWGWAASLSPSRDLPPGWTVQKLIANLPQIYFLAKSSINILRVIQVTRKRGYLKSFSQLSEYERIQRKFISLPCYPFEFWFLSFKISHSVW